MAGTAGQRVGVAGKQALLEALIGVFGVGQLVVDIKIEPRGEDFTALGIDLLAEAHTAIGIGQGNEIGRRPCCQQ